MEANPHSDTPSCEVHRSEAGDIRIELKGKFDVGTAPAMRRRLAASLGSPNGDRVVIDLF